MVLFRGADGSVAALEDRCCHKELPLSLGTLEARGLRCGYHGMLYDSAGSCIEAPGQKRIPPGARVRSFPLREQDQILWVWVGVSATQQPNDSPPDYPFHSATDYEFDGDVFHYAAPYQLIHDNLLDLSHLGYVHLKTIGGNPGVHMNAELKVTHDDHGMQLVRRMPDSDPPPTYLAAWPFPGRIDRWQEVDFRISHFLIWTGGMETHTGSLSDPAREGFHLRGFHGVTPETAHTSHYFWSVATNPHPERPGMTRTIIEQTAATFAEDQVVIEAQWRNQQRFPGRQQVFLSIDAAPAYARRLIDRLLRANPEA
jgi:vanillate O-demethylase monooxygenase subunit